MLNAACLSPFSVPCHRYHLTQELFGGRLFQAIESRSKPALCFCDSVFSSSFLHNQSLAASGAEREGESTPQRCIISRKYDQLSRGREQCKNMTSKQCVCVCSGLEFLQYFVTHSYKMLHLSVWLSVGIFEGREKTKEKGIIAPRQRL